MIYRKRGAVVRYESGVIVRIREAGEAIEEGETFRCAPIAAEPLPMPDAADVERTAGAIRDLGANIERLIVSEGIAEHEYGDKRWRDTSRRIHLSMVKGRMRAIVDLASFDLEAIAHVANTLARSDERELDAPPRLVLEPAVSASVSPFLIGAAPPNVELWQTGGGTDGCGNVIEERRIDSPPWPNWYRPSYRVRPVRMPLDLRARCAVTAIERDRPRAVALLAPPSGLTLRVLVEDGARAYPSTVRIARIDAVADDAVWYPYGGGSFGAEMML